MAVEAVRQLVGDGDGPLWEDQDGVVWAVRLVPASNGGWNSFFGFSISWSGSALQFAPERRDQDEGAVTGTI